nr:50S ribosomal protein [Ipomoea batatas]GME21647.1 50S ribosomal protein [Ipomoea batatas]
MRRLTSCTIFANSHFPPTIPTAIRKTLLQLSTMGFFSLSPLFPTANARLEECRIELVDSEAWKVSSGLAEAWRGNVEKRSKVKPLLSDEEEMVKYAPPPNKEDLDFDEIEEMRIRGNLFYKLDKDSKEYAEYKFDFHGRNRNKGNKKEKLGNETSLAVERSPRFDKNNVSVSWLHEFEASAVAKTKRSQTFNQATAAYHEPFCLDIYISKGSARASIIHRATSKVVAVAHSISKDMKFELSSTKNRAACAAVGEVLAQRALADDIHNVIYTPRKGERLEGKLQIVFQAIIDGGIDVKVKLKQRKTKKTSILPPKP